MRIGTWNLDGRWDTRHVDLLLSLDCDVLLLTEVKVGAELPAYSFHHTSQPMLEGKHWAAVFTRGALTPLPDPQPTTALAEMDDVRCASSVLPWRGCAPYWPGPGSDTTERTRHAVDAIAAATPTIWGGDWNHSLPGPEMSGSLGGRAAIEDALGRLELRVATTDLPSRIGGLGSIDHVAVPVGSVIVSADRIATTQSKRPLSDHDAYVIELSSLSQR